MIVVSCALTGKNARKLISRELLIKLVVLNMISAKYAKNLQKTLIVISLIIIQFFSILDYKSSELFEHLSECHMKLRINFKDLLKWLNNA